MQLTLYCYTINPQYTQLSKYVMTAAHEVNKRTNRHSRKVATINFDTFEYRFNMPFLDRICLNI